MQNFIIITSCIIVLLTVLMIVFVPVDTTDHTAEFNKRDVFNLTICLSKNEEYSAFRQCMENIRNSRVNELLNK